MWKMLYIGIGTQSHNVKRNFHFIIVQIETIRHTKYSQMMLLSNIYLPHKL